MATLIERISNVVTALGGHINSLRTRVTDLEGTRQTAAQVQQSTKNRNFTGDTDKLSKAIIDDAGNGPYSNYDCRAYNYEKVIFDATIAGRPESGGMRDNWFSHLRDNDVTNYEQYGYRVITNNHRLYTSGACNASGFQVQWKDLHGIWATAIGRSGGRDRGMSGGLFESVQLGTGVATNEFSAGNPNYSIEHAALLAPVLGIIYNQFADVTGFHFAYGVQANMLGYLSTAAFRAASVPSVGKDGAARYGLQMDEMIATEAGITMPQGRAGSPNTGTVIRYDPDDYTFYDRATNTWGLIIGGQNVFQMDEGSWVPYTPTLVPMTGAFTSATALGRWKRFGKTIHFKARIQIDQNGTAGAGIYVLLPFEAASISGIFETANGRDQSGGPQLQGQIAGTHCYVVRYDNNYPGGDGRVLQISGTYEAKKKAGEA